MAQVVETFDDPRLRLVRHAENVGIVGNFSRSLLGASTEYVIQLGDDDVAEPTLVERTVAALDAYPSAGFAHSRFALIDTSGALLVAEEDWLGTPSTPLEEGTEFVKRSMARLRVCSSTAMIRRAAVPEDGFRQEDYPPFDYGFWLRIAEDWDVAWIEEALCKYRIHSQSFTSSLGEITADRGVLIADKSLREKYHDIKRRHAATLERGPRRSQLEKLADRALLKALVEPLRQRTLPERRLQTLRGLASLARRDPKLVLEPTAWKLLAGSVVGAGGVEKLKGLKTRP